MDRRTKFRQGLHPLYLPKYDALCDRLPHHWQPYQGFRTFEVQDSLFALGRTIKGKIVTNARGGESAHCYGCATDWVLWDIESQPIWLEKYDSAWQEYTDAVTACNLKSGSVFGDIDHNELLIKCSWRDILKVYNNSGMGAAIDLIQKAAL